MKFVRRSIAILVLTLVLLFLAMFVLKTLQSGGELTLEALKDTAIREVRGDLQKLGTDAQALLDKARTFVEELLKKLPKAKS